MQTMMGIMQMVLLPLSFLSGALYPIANLPRWLHTLVLLNPVTYAVNAVRTTMFAFIDAPQPVLDKVNPPITWFGWEVPMALQLGIVVVIGLALLGVAIRQFQKVE
jgi:ABC-2 type transport system permease protein